MKEAKNKEIIVNFVVRNGEEKHSLKMSLPKSIVNGRGLLTEVIKNAIFNEIVYDVVIPRDEIKKGN